MILLIIIYGSIIKHKYEAYEPPPIWDH